MKSPDEIKKGLACPVTVRSDLLPCSDCSYHGRNVTPCRIAVIDDAMAYIEQLEERIALMKIQMEGDCGTCAHKAHDKACIVCLQDPTKPLWEYEGLPELQKKGES